MSPDEGGRTRYRDEALDLLRTDGRPAIFSVPGSDSSMVPTLDPCDLVAVELSPPGFRPGDLLVFRQADYEVVHRYLGPARRAGGLPCLRTRGDGAIAIDPPLDRSRVIGRAVAVRRGDGWRDLTGRAARVYARAVALHLLAWSGLAVLVCGRAGRRTALRRAVVAIDRGLLRLCHAALFRVCHRRTEPPTGTNPSRLP